MRVTCLSCVYSHALVSTCFCFVDVSFDAPTFEVEHKTVRQDHARIFIQKFLDEACDSTPVATGVAEDEVEGCKVILIMYIYVDVLFGCLDN